MASGGKEYQLAIKIAGKVDSSFTSAVSSASSSMSSLGALGKAAGASVKLTAQALAATATAVAGVAAASIKTGSEFEAAMSSVAATAGVTEEEYAALEAAAMEMGRTTSKTATESANALEYMALAGWDVEQSIKGLPSILRLSEATGLDLATTSDLVTDSMSALGVTVDGLSDYLDIAAKANNKSNQTAQQLMEAYLGVGGTMKNLNVPLAESATALGVLANRGIKGSEAGNALNAIMVNLTTGTGQAGKMMAKLGVSAFDSEGNFIGLEKTLQSLNNALANCTEEERNAALAAIGGKTHVDALNDLMSGLNTEVAAGVSEWANLEAELSNAGGALEQMAGIKLDNLSGDMAIFKSALEDTGIKIYKNIQEPLRGAVKFGTAEIYKLSDALENGGFSGMLDVVGDVISDCVSQIAEGAPAFIDTTANILEHIIDGIDQNAPQIGEALARAGTRLVTALIRLTPKLIVTGAHLIVEFLKGIKEHFPEIKAAAKEAVQYLMEEAKKALKGYVNFLGDDEVAPFEKILGLIPAVIAGFAGFKMVGGAVSGIKGLISTFSGIGKASSVATNGLGAVGSSMSSMAKNILGAGVGFGLAAAGIWLLVEAAKGLVNAGPEAAIALVLMVGGIAALMVLAAKMGSELQASQQGLIAFGAAILMAAAGMAIMAFAAMQLAAAGPMALVALALMEGGIIALMAIAGSMGTQLATAAPGLLAFGIAILLAAGGMALMAFSATQLAAAGGPAIAILAGMVIALAAFMVLAAALGPMLITGGAGMLLLGAGLLLAAAGMALLAFTAIQLSSAGGPALIIMAALLVGVLAFGAAAGLLAPLLLAGSVAVAAFGAALMVVSLAAILGSVALLIIAGALPSLAEYGMSGALAIMALGASMTIFSLGAALAGIGAIGAALGFGALALAAGAAVLVFAPLALEMVTVATAIATIAACAVIAAEGINALKDCSAGIILSMGKLALAFPPVALAIAPFALAVASGTLAVVALAASLVATDAALALMLLAIVGVSAGLIAMNAAIALFRAQAMIIGASAQVAAAGFALLVPVIAPTATALLTIIAPMTAAGVAAVAMAGGMTMSLLAVAAMSVAILAMSGALIAAAVGFGMLGSAISSSLNQANTVIQNATNIMRTTASTGMTQVAQAMVSGLAMTIAMSAISVTALGASISSGMAAVIAVILTGFISLAALASVQMLLMQLSAATSLAAMKKDFAASFKLLLISTITSFALIRASIVSEMTQAAIAVRLAIASIRSAMNFSWSLPHLEMPHIQVTGSFSMNPPKVPDFSVKWYKEGGILDGAQIFGAAGNTLLGGGEAGKEAVLPLDDLWTQMRMILADVVGQSNSSSMAAFVDRLDALNAGSQGQSMLNVMDYFNGDVDDGDNGDEEPTYHIVYSPEFHFHGEAPSQDDMTAAARMSQDEFNDMMDGWIKANGRKKF